MFSLNNSSYVSLATKPGHVSSTTRVMPVGTEGREETVVTAGTGERKQGSTGMYIYII